MILDDYEFDDQVSDVQVTDDQVVDEQIVDDQVTSDQASGDHDVGGLSSGDFVLDEQIAGGQAAGDQVTNDQVTDDMVIDNQDSVDQVTDDQDSDDQVSDDLSLFDSVWQSVTDFVTPFVDSSDEREDPLLNGYELVDIETYALSPVISASGLKGVLLDVIGPYDNIITQYRYQANNSTSYSYVHETTPDYPWIFSAILFICLILSLFSLIKRFFTWMK